MKRRRYVLASVIAAAGFAALFAVLPSQGSGTEVVMRGNRYRPATIWIGLGGAITFANEDKVTHTASCQGKGCPRDPGDVQPGLFRTLTFTSAGTFHVVCRYHGEGGMIATVVVGGTSLGPSPTPTTSTSPSPSPAAT